MTDPGRPRTFCRYTAMIRFRSGEEQTLTEPEPVRFTAVFDVAGHVIEGACFQRAKQTTGDDHPVSIDLRVHSFETECTE